MVLSPGYFSSQLNCWVTLKWSNNLVATALFFALRTTKINDPSLRAERVRRAFLIKPERSAHGVEAEAGDLRRRVAHLHDGGIENCRLGTHRPEPLRPDRIR